MLKPILLAEDNPRDLELTLIALERTNLSNEVVVARDGAEALDYMASEGKFSERKPGNPVVVILDIKMPKMDGIEVLAKIRSTPGWTHVPVVMLTSSKEQCDLMESYKLGVNAYVVKPVAFQDFIDAIAGLGMFWGIYNAPPKSM